MTNKSELSRRDFMKAGLGALATIGLTGGCNDKNYSFDFTIGNEHVTLSKTLVFNPRLEVIRGDGTVITYLNMNSDDVSTYRVIITKDGVTTSYNNDEIGKLVIGEAKKQFDDYLIKIKGEKDEVIKEKQRKALEDLLGEQIK